jgi:hypothetical protein
MMIPSQDSIRSRLAYNQGVEPSRIRLEDVTIESVESGGSTWEGYVTISVDYEVLP